jgi:hypothetical protein
MTNEKEVQIDEDNRMLVSDVPVNLPEKVQVVDRKYGKRIGYIDRAEVTKVLEDSCFMGFEDTVSGEFMIAYSTDELKRTVAVETDDPFEFFKVIQDNIETAIGSDDVKRLRLGASYIDKAGRNHLIEIHIKHLKNVAHIIHPDLKNAINGDGTEESKATGPGERIVNYFRENKQ